MLRIIPVILVFCFIQNSAISQTFNWAKSTTANSIDSYIEPGALDVDASGNVYSCGSITAGFDFDPGAGTTLLTGNSNGQDVYIKKQDAAGNLLWAKALQGPDVYATATGIVVDNNMNVYVTGTFDESVDFDPGPGTQLYTPNGFQASFIVKLNSNGQLVWAKYIDGSSSCSIASIVLDNSGNLLLGGSFDGQADMDPGSGTQNATSLSGTEAFALKLDASGNYIWHRQFQGSSFAVVQTIATFNNHLYMSGYFMGGPCDFDPGPATQMATSNSFSMDAFVVELDQQGNYVKHLVFGGAGDEMPQTIRVDASGNMYLSGNFDGTCDFDPGGNTAILSSNSGSVDPFVMKFNANGNLVWVGLLDGPNDETMMDMDIDDVGNMYTTGYFYSSMDLDPSAGTAISTTNGVEDIFFNKISSNGTLIQSANLGSLDPDGGFSLTIRNYSIYAEGLYSGTVDFNPSPASNTLTSAFPGMNNDMYTYRWDQCTPSTSTINATGCTYTLNGQIYSGNGTYTQILTSSSGCDSIITINLTGSATNTHIYPVICGAPSYTYNGQTYTATGVYTQYHTNSNGCDSNTIIHLSIGVADTTVLTESACDYYIFNNQFLMSSGTYTQNYTNTTGCDSLIILNLTINTGSYNSIFVNSCGPYTYNGAVYNTSDVYLFSFVGANGCDSTIELNLTVNSLPNNAVTQNGATLSSSASAPTTYQWLTCNPYSVINGATSSTFTAMANGDYAVEVTLNGCKDTSACKVVSGLGLNDFSFSSNIKMWPNPVNDVVYIESDKVQDDWSCQVLSTTGQVILKTTDIRKKNIELPVKSLSTGIYFLHVHNGKEEAVFRFVKE